MSKYIPCEFARKPRSLSELDRWKATEFRQFLLYTGPVVLTDVLPTALYNNFLSLSISIYLMLSPTLFAHYCDYADNLIKYFLEQFRSLYGVEEMVYNVHSLCHLADDVRRFGPLDGVSAFCFENFLGHLKRKVRKPQHILQQITHVLERQSKPNRST